MSIFGIRYSWVHKCSYITTSTFSISFCWVRSITERKRKKKKGKKKRKEEGGILTLIFPLKLSWRKTEYYPVLFCNPENFQSFCLLLFASSSRKNWTGSHFMSLSLAVVSQLKSWKDLTFNELVACQIH